MAALPQSDAIVWEWHVWGAGVFHAVARKP